MKIGILASQAKRNAWENKETPSSTYSWVQDNEGHEHYDVFLDLDFDDNSYRLQDYLTNTNTTFVLGAVKCTLESAAVGLQVPENWKGIGINALPTFIERNTLECTNPYSIAETALRELADLLGYSNVEVVGSRVGLVTPRVICMIINEAFYTVQEGTANREDINQAMRLGTNYPKGPFEWCEAMGLQNVYEVLEAMYNDTKDERYKICSLLKQEYLVGK
ncbi:MAG: 3-hydroxyacyl-CoA dehydrogenase [Bacteroidetes bacterium]|jgi:3-hydroxybutyryl-CoA dehydrogenase|nr:3-hydroxyacyl-CoA dehydrogenase [Bacteroidota bacterium]